MAKLSPLTTFPSLNHLIFVSGVETEQRNKTLTVSLTVMLFGICWNLGGAKDKNKNGTAFVLIKYADIVAVKMYANREG